MDPLAPGPRPLPRSNFPPGSDGPEKENLLSFPLLLSICLNLLCSRLMNPSSSTHTGIFFINVFLVIHCCKNKLWGIVTSRQTLGLFSNSKVLPQNPEFRKTDYPKIIHGYHSELKWTEQMPDWWIKYVWISNNLREQDIFQYHLKVS